MKRVIVGITGASGVIYGIRLIKALKRLKGVETHLIITPEGEKTIGIETSLKVNEVHKLADFVYDISNLSASLSSGSFITHGMVIIPCTIKTLSAVTNSFNNNLLVRAADVTLKEGRPLIAVPRETPLHKGHLKIMLNFVENGGILIPPFPAFYHKPKTIDDIIDQTTGKILDRLHIENNLFKRWESR